jgi:tetratricopeptide (TPR) repeat protein
MASQDPPSIGPAVTTTAALQADQTPPVGVKFSYFEQFIKIGKDKRGDDYFKSKTTGAVVEFVKELTKDRKESLCTYLSQHTETRDFVGTATVFISHAWAYDFLMVVKAVKTFLFQHRGTYGRPQDVVVFFDLFSNCQHDTDEKMDYKWLSATFRRSVHAMNTVVMVIQPWNDPIALKRAWCVYEMFACASSESKCKFDVAMTNKERGNFLRSIMAGDATRMYFDMLASISTERCEATMPADREKIGQDIKMSLAGGFPALDDIVIRSIENWMASKLEDEYNSARAKNKITLSLQIAATRIRILLSQGRSREARTTAVDCLALLQSGLPKDSPSPASADKQHNLSKHQRRQYMLSFRNVIAEIDDPTVKMLKRCLKGCVKLLGLYHPDSQDTASSLARCYCDSGMFDKAQVLLDRHCPNQRNTYDVFLNAKTCERRGDFEAAELHIQQHLQELQELASDHPMVLACTDQLSCLYQAQGKFDQAKEGFQECVSASRRIFCRFHPTRLTYEVHLARLNIALEDYKCASEALTKAADLYKISFGETHRFTNSLRHEIGKLLLAEGLIVEAESLITSAVETAEKGHERADTVTFSDSLARAYERLGRYDDAAKLYWCNITGSTTDAMRHSSINALMDMYSRNIGTFVDKRAAIAKWVSRRARKLLIRSRCSAPSSTDPWVVLDAMHYTLRLLLVLGEYPKALDVASECLEKTSSLLGETNPDTMATLLCYSVCLSMMRSPQAKIPFRRCLELYKKIYPPLHSKSADVAVRFAKCSQNDAQEVEVALYSWIEGSLDNLQPADQEWLRGEEGSIRYRYYRDNGVFALAELYLVKCLELRMPANTDNSHQTLEDLFQLYQLPIEQRIQRSPYSRERTVERIIGLGSRYLEIGLFRAGETFFKNLYDEVKLTYGNGHPLSRKVWNSLMNAYTYQHNSCVIT